MKANALAGRSFATWGALEAHLAAWRRDIADRRRHGTTGEPPGERFARDEATALKPLAGPPPFLTVRELVRPGRHGCAVAVDGNAYPVPWQLIGGPVQVWTGCRSAMPARKWRRMPCCRGDGRATDAAHFAGVAGTRERPLRSAVPDPSGTGPQASLLRPLAEYEAVVSGGGR